MNIRKTEKEVLSSKDILDLIADYEKNEVLQYNTLWRYYIGKNEKIVDRKPPDPNNPFYNIPVPYGRKIVTTWSGYGARPKYITYKPEDSETENLFFDELQNTYRDNNEHIKTSRAWRNMGIFGLGREILYIDKLLSTDINLPIKADVKFYTVDPRETIVLYDYSPEPQKKIGIHFYKINDNWFKVEVYYAKTVEYYNRRKNEKGEWDLSRDGNPMINWFKPDIPMVDYPFGDDCMGLIDPVKDLIDTYDLLTSDSVIEFDRFSHAYLVMKKVMLTNPMLKKEPGVVSNALKFLKYRRVFELMDKDADVKFLTKDIPFGFIKFMTDLIREQIHIQSHVPDFTSDKMAGASGIAIQRLLFDFENVVSNAEADFDVGLRDRMKLINTIYGLTNRVIDGDPNSIIINHKRNVPLNLQEFANAAATMRGAGFSAYLCADIMPDDIVPDVEAELERQKEEQEAMMPDVYAGASGMVDEEGNPIGGGLAVDENGNPIADSETDAAVVNMGLNGAQLQSMVAIAQAVSEKTLPFDTAVDLILIAIPGITRAIVEKMIRPAANFISANVKNKGKSVDETL